MFLQGGIQFLSRAEMYKIHRAMLEILGDPGLEIELPEEMYAILETFKGVSVDRNHRLVRLGPEPVLETIQQLTGARSPEITEHGTDKPDQPLCLPSKIIGQIGSHHGFVFDVDQWNLRPATHADVRKFILLRRALPDVVKDNIGLLSQDVPREVMWIHAAAMNALYQKGGIYECNDLTDAPWIGRILEAAGMLKQSDDFILSVSPFPCPPLRLIGRSAHLFVHAIRLGKLPFVSSMGLMGGSSPISLPATLAMVYAEFFGYNTLARLLCPHPEARYSPRPIGCDHGILDPRTCHTVNGRPENQLLRAWMGQMSGEFYKAPDGRGFVVSAISDAAEPGIQAAMESALGAAVELCKGFYSYRTEVTAVYKSLGRLQGNLALCPEWVLVDHEIMRWLQSFLTPREIQPDQLPLNVIRNVGPGGSFMACEHTLDHYQELWRPELLHQGSWEMWIQNGKRTPLDMAKEKIHAIFSQPEPEPVLPDDTVREIRHLVREAEKALLGTTTGVLI